MLRYRYKPDSCNELWHGLTEYQNYDSSSALRMKAVHHDTLLELRNI